MSAAGRASTGDAPSTISWRPCSKKKQDEAFRAVSLRRLLTGESDPQDTSEL